MASTLLRRLSDPVIRRWVEETVERAMREQLATGSSDENAVAKRFFRLASAADSGLAQMINAIPGFRYAPHVGLSLAAEYVRERSDQLFPGDSRPMIGMLRQVLRHSAPVLEGVGDATADVLEGKIDAAVDAAKAPVHSRAAKGLLDLVQVWFDGKACLVIPVLDREGAVVRDAFGDPVPSDLPAADAERWLSERFTKGKTKQVRNSNGKGTHEVPEPPEKRRLSGEIGLEACIQLLGGPRGLSHEQAERIEKFLAVKPGYFASWGDDVWDVIRAYNATFALRKAQTGFDWLDQAETEGLVQTTLKAQPDLTLIHELIGKAFKSRIGANGARPGELSLADCDELEQVVFDMWLGGEQPLGTKLLRQARRIRRSAAMRGSSPIAALFAVASLTSPIWGVIAIWGTLFLIATVLYGRAVTQSLTATTTFLGHGPFTGIQLILVATIVSSWMILFLSWLMGWARTPLSLLGFNKESVESTARKLRVFGFLLPGLNAYTALLAGPIEARLGVIVAVGTAIGIASTVIDVGYRHRVEKAIADMSWVLNLALVTLPLIWFMGWGPSLDGDVQANAKSVLGIALGSKAVQSIGLLLVLGMLGYMVRRLERPSVIGDKTIVQRIPLARMIMLIIFVFGIVAIWFNEPEKANLVNFDLWNSEVGSTDIVTVDGKSKVRVRTTTYQDGTTHTRTKGRVDAPRSPVPSRSAPTPAPTSAPANPRLKELCDADLVAYTTCHAQGYK